MATSLDSAGWQDWSNRLVEPHEPKSTSLVSPAHRFRCRIEEHPDHLVPRQYLENPPGMVPPDRPLYVNSNCWFERSGAAPGGVRLAELSPPISDTQCVVWIADPWLGTKLPFAIGSDLLDLLSGCRSADVARLDLEPRVRQALLMAEVLIPDDWNETRSRQWSAALERAAAEFRQKGYVPLRGLIHPFQISALRRYYRMLIRTGQMRLGDAQCARRYIAHNEPVASFFHQQLVNAVSAFSEEPVKPSYVYAGAYQEGARLEKHTDRQQCEFSLTLCLDYAPEPHRGTPWPIQLHTENGTTTIFQELGDALLYRGRRIPHSRGVLPAEHSSTSIFFHYVGRDFTGPLS